MVGTVARQKVNEVSCLFCTITRDKKDKRFPRKGVYKKLPHKFEMLQKFYGTEQNYVAILDLRKVGKNRHGRLPLFSKPNIFPLVCLPDPEPVFVIKEPRNQFPAWQNRFLNSLNVYKCGALAYFCPTLLQKTLLHLPPLRFYCVGLGGCTQVLERKGYVAD